MFLSEAKAVTEEKKVPVFLWTLVWPRTFSGSILLCEATGHFYFGL